MIKRNFVIANSINQQGTSQCSIYNIVGGMLVFTVQKNGSFLKTSVCFSGRLVYYSLAPRNRRLCLFFFLQMEVKTYRAKAKSYVMNQLRLIEVTTRRLTNPCMTWKFYFRGLVAGRLSPDSVSTQSVLHYD